MSGEQTRPLHPLWRDPDSGGRLQYGVSDFRSYFPPVWYVEDFKNVSVY